ncbi:glycoside hydrolase family 31 protein [Cognatitamlana onchidii]|uniref:glycoside hydrolase family 31 protein n=1 Tax=Cognatitamlana onchidii TaxID=2562860 RepID=UPI0010A60ACD|nr:TIM-barrel domain-containing protein [Algibacter onchidii]
MRLLFNILLVLLSIQTLKGQNLDRVFERILETNNGLEIYVSDGKYEVTFYNDKIVETTFVPKGENSMKKSHAVVLKVGNVNYVSTKDSGTYNYVSEGLGVHVEIKPFQISYTYKNKPLISEKAGYVKNDSLETIQFNLSKDEMLYGGGARALGMNRRGNRLELYNKAHYGYETRSELMNFTLPIVLSSNKYMVHFDNAPIGFLDLDSKSDNTLTYETISGRKTYQIIAGDSWYDMLDNYTSLTGKQPMPARWILGNFSSRFGYHSQRETEETITAFKRDSIPVDAVILDLFWFGKTVEGTMGNLEVFKDSFPDFEGMITRLKSKDIKTVVITEPFVLTTSKRWEDAVSKDVLAKDSLGNPFTYDFYFGNTGLIDIYKPEGEAWFWDIYKNDIINKGVAGIWGDLGEPEVHPKALRHVVGSADEVHNIYGHDWARLVYEGYQRDFTDVRPFILMRAGYSGSQRFGLIPWSGDVNRTWGGLQSQPEIALQMGMQGLAYMHSDLGGFAGDNLDDELYVRWLQYGVFQPIYRPHAQENVPSEPVFRSQKAKKLAKQAILLRYKMLPYNYNLVFENNQYAKPLMRPLLFEEPENDKMLAYSETYLWGHDFLVSPVLKSKKLEQDVYFPKDNIWFDFYSNERIEGGVTKMIHLKEDHIPVYVRAGAFIPMAHKMQSTNEYNHNNWELHYYHDASVKRSNRTIYNDDGETPNAFEKGEYELLELESDVDKRNLNISFKSKKGNYFKHSLKTINLVIHNVDKKPKWVKISGRKKIFSWDEKQNLLIIVTSWNTIENQDVSIKLKK